MELVMLFLQVLPTAAPALADLLQLVIWILASVTAVSWAVTAFFLRETWRQIQELRRADREREVQVARIDERVDSLERDRPAPAGAAPPGSNVYTRPQSARGVSP